MQSTNRAEGRALRARGYAALLAMLAIGLVEMAWPAAAEPYAYVTNHDTDSVTVIDRETNKAVATIPVGVFPSALVVSPDGKQVYVLNQAIVGDPQDFTVSVIDAAKNTVAATISLPSQASAIAVNPDGKHVYIATFVGVVVIDTKTNKIATTIPTDGFGGEMLVSPDGKQVYSSNFYGIIAVETATHLVTGPFGAAESPRFVLSPDGKFIYALNNDGVNGSYGVMVIDTASKKVLATIAPGRAFNTISITPDGKRIYVASAPLNFLYEIDTASKTIAATIPLAGTPDRLVLTPDGKRAYFFTINFQNPFTGLARTLSVLDVASNTIVATLPNYGFPLAVTADGKQLYLAEDSFAPGSNNHIGILDTATNTLLANVDTGGLGSIALAFAPLRFRAFSAELEIGVGRAKEESFTLQSEFTLKSASNGINPVTEPVTLQVGAFFTTIPAGSFQGSGFGPFAFRGVIDGVKLETLIRPTGSKRFELEAQASNADLKGTESPTPVSLTIGDDRGETTVKSAAED